MTKAITSTTSGTASIEPPGQEPACIKGYENNDSSRKFNTQNNPLSLSGLDIKLPRIFGCLIFSPLRECYLKIPSMDEDGRADSHNQCKHCSYGELAGVSGDSQQSTLPYNDFSANGNYPLNFVSQPKGALHAPSPTPHPRTTDFDFGRGLRVAAKATKD
jgi:hypothetical protein